MDKKRKRQLLQNREDFIGQLYQGTACIFRSLLCLYDVFCCEDCLSTKEITKWSQFEPIWDKLQKVVEVEQGERIKRKMIELTARKITDEHHLELLKVNPSWNREEHLNDFLNWLHTNHVDTSNFEVSLFNNYGMGLKATKDLPVRSSSIFRFFSIVIDFSQINAFWWYHYQSSLQVKQS